MLNSSAYTSINNSDSLFLFKLRWRQRRSEWLKGSFRWNPRLPFNGQLNHIDATFLTAIRQNDLDSANRLVSLGANIQAAENLALSMAAAAGNIRAVTYLLDLGADIHSRNESPLSWATRQGNEPLEKLLLARGADAKKYSVICASIDRQRTIANPVTSQS